MKQIIYRFVVVAAACGNVMAVTPAVAQASSITDERAVSHLEDQYLQSRVSGDVSVIEQGFAADGVFIHENGTERTKSAYITEFASQPRWTSVYTTERTIHVYGNAAVTHAILYLRVTAVPTVARLRETGVYVRQGDAWRIVSWQSTPLTDVRYSVIK